MIKRISTGLMLAAGLVLLWILQGPFMRVFIALITVMAVCEMQGALEKGGMRPVKWVAPLYAAVSMPVYLLLGEEAMLPLLIVFVLLGMGAVVLSGKPEFERIAGTVVTLVYPGLTLTMFYPLQDIPSPYAATLIMGLSFAVPLLSDVFAWAIGRKWGRRKLAPVISPKKTVEGALGGLVGSVVVVPPVMLIARLIMLIRGVAVTGADIPNMWALLLVSLLAGAASQIGDLAASTVKRWCGVKDYSNILPGHGGIMDRIDSVLFSIVVFHIYCGLFMGAAL